MIYLVNCIFSFFIWTAVINGPIPVLIPSGEGTETVWAFEKYIPVEGKELGIMTFFHPEAEYYNLKNVFGFTGIYISNSAEAEVVKKAGFRYENILPVVDGKDLTFPDGDFKVYFLDEPVEHEIPAAKIIDVALKLKKKNALLYLSSYKGSKRVRGEYSRILNSADNIRIMCDQFYDGTIFCGGFQGGWWEDFNEWYPGKVSGHWMNLLVDGIQQDFDDLFKLANELKIKRLWLYAGNVSHSWFMCITRVLVREDYDKYIKELTEAAWKNGWLRRIERKYIKTYSYDNKGYRILEKSTGTDELREVFQNLDK